MGATLRFLAEGSPPLLPPNNSGPDIEDSANQHLQDIVVGGRSVNDKMLADIMTRGAEKQVEELRRFGVKFQTADAGRRLFLTTDAGHSQTRLVNGENRFGTDYTLRMREHSIKQGVRFLEGIVITKLLKHSGHVVGAMGIDAQGGVQVFGARAVVLASGGLGQIYQRHDNVKGSTGDGYVLAYEAGVPLKDMEFVQFYPVSLGPGTPTLDYERFLLETQAKMLNSRGEDVVVKHGLADRMLLTRDRLSQVMASEILDGLGVNGMLVLDLTEIPKDRMETLKSYLPKAALRGERQIPVAPTVHFQMGGLEMNERGETCVPGLLAAGEVCAGLHGANRLSGNALTEAWVFGSIAGREAAKWAKDNDTISLPADEIAAELNRLQRLAASRGGEDVETLRNSIKETMWKMVGIIRDEDGLQQALNDIEELQDRYRRVSLSKGRGIQAAVKLGFMLVASEMVCRSALFRRESRGAHFRRDYPAQNDMKWFCNVYLARTWKRMELTARPV